MAAIVTETPLQLGPASAGIILTPEAFDSADFEEGWRYELINEVLVGSPSPLRNERDPNEELGRWLRNYQEDHPQGAALDATIHEETIKLRRNRRRPDRAIWAGLGRLPTRDDPPTIVVEFVSAGRASWRRDYEIKSAEYRALGVREYWIIDRFQGTLTVHDFTGRRQKIRVVKRDQTYSTALLPGFDPPLGRLLKVADRWTD